jgi:hypothetical protein
VARPAFEQKRVAPPTIHLADAVPSSLPAELAGHGSRRRVLAGGRDSLLGIEAGNASGFDPERA